MFARLKQKGEMSIMALVLGGITIIGSFVGIGVKVGRIETRQENTEQVAVEAKTKAESVEKAQLAQLEVWGRVDERLKNIERANGLKVGKALVEPVVSKE